MSEVLPYEENITHYGDDGDEEQISLTCRLQNNSSNFFSSTQNKRAPKLGQIGRSKRGEGNHLFTLFRMSKTTKSTFTSLKIYINVVVFDKVKKKTPN